MVKGKSKVAFYFYLILSVTHLIGFFSKAYVCIPHILFYAFFFYVAGWLFPISMYKFTAFF